MTVLRITGTNLLRRQSMEAEERVIRSEAGQARSGDLGPGCRELGLVVERTEDLDRVRMLWSSLQ